MAAVAGDYRCGWHTVHNHVITVADAALEAKPAPVQVLGIDETRRGKAEWETDSEVPSKPLRPSTIDLNGVTATFPPALDTEVEAILDALEAEISQDTEISRH